MTEQFSPGNYLKGLSLLLQSTARNPDGPHASRYIDPATGEVLSNSPDVIVLEFGVPGAPISDLIHQQEATVLPFKRPEATS